MNKKLDEVKIEQEIGQLRVEVKIEQKIGQSRVEVKIEQEVGLANWTIES